VEAEAGADEFVATLVGPSEYAHHLNQVAGLSTQRVTFLKRKFLSTSGHELVTYPVADCARARYFDERPVKTIVFGILLVGLVAAMAVGLISTWKQLDAGTRVPVGLLGLAGLYGVRRLFGARRHRLVFILRDGTELSWASRPGDHSTKRVAVERVLEFLRSRELLDRSLRPS
jgi:hypothetical protein